MLPCWGLKNKQLFGNDSMLKYIDIYSREIYVIVFKRLVVLYSSSTSEFTGDNRLK